MCNHWGVTVHRTLAPRVEAIYMHYAQLCLGELSQVGQWLMERMKVLCNRVVVGHIVNQ